MALVKFLLQFMQQILSANQIKLEDMRNLLALIGLPAAKSTASTMPIADISARVFCSGIRLRRLLTHTDINICKNPLLPNHDRPQLDEFKQG